MGQPFMSCLFPYLAMGMAGDFQFSRLLSIRNTDVTNSIIITSSFYNSDGKLVKQYLERPIQLGALASQIFF